MDAYSGSAPDGRGRQRIERERGRRPKPKAKALTLAVAAGGETKEYPDVFGESSDEHVSDDKTITDANKKAGAYSSSEALPTIDEMKSKKQRQASHIASADKIVPLGSFVHKNAWSALEND